MNKEELIGKLQMVYVGDRNALNELIGYYDGLKTISEEVTKENKQLQITVNNCKERIDKAIEYIENDLKSFLYSIEYQTLLKILKGDSNE